ncbi:hypothetical protein Dimus_018966 [Dionaea muscipula]
MAPLARFFSHDDDGARQQSLRVGDDSEGATGDEVPRIQCDHPLPPLLLLPRESSTTTTGDGMMQRAGSLSNNSAEVQSNNRLCCGNFGLETWVSHTTKNYKRPYWRCKHCGQFVRWIEAEDIKNCLELKEEVCQLRDQIAANDVALKELTQSVEAVNRRFVIIMAITLLLVWYFMS